MVYTPTHSPTDRNSHPLGSIGITPAELLFGNAVSLNDRILPTEAYIDKVKKRGNAKVTEKVPLSKVTAEMLAVQAKLIAKHQSLLRQRDAKHMAVPFDNRQKIDHFPIGSYVLVEYDPTLQGRRPPHKLMPFKRGPYQVVNNIGTRYTLLDLVTNKHEDVLIHRLHPFNFDETEIDPKAIASKDNGEFEVSEILKHEGNPKYKTSLRFLVHWTGYDDPKHHTWESWNSLRLVDKLHDYLRKHDMGNLIPKECLDEQTPEPSKFQKKRKRLEKVILDLPTKGLKATPRKKTL